MIVYCQVAQRYIREANKSAISRFVDPLERCVSQCPYITRVGEGREDRVQQVHMRGGRSPLHLRFSGACHQRRDPVTRDGQPAVVDPAALAQEDTVPCIGMRRAGKRKMIRHEPKVPPSSRIVRRGTASDPKVWRGPAKLCFLARPPHCEIRLIRAEPCWLSWRDRLGMYR